ncbi:hypothetical protein ACE1TI_18525 [Alteribacillus sp. JSM 102045]
MKTKLMHSRANVKELSKSISGGGAIFYRLWEQKIYYTRLGR